MDSKHFIGTSDIVIKVIKPLRQINWRDMIHLYSHDKYWENENETNGKDMILKYKKTI